MQNISKAGIGALVTLVFVGLKAFGIELPDALGAEVTEAIGTLVGAILLVWGQIKRPDLIAGIIRK